VIVFSTGGKRILHEWNIQPGGKPFPDLDIDSHCCLIQEDFIRVILDLIEKFYPRKEL
jgi:hypothetical protein